VRLRRLQSELGDVLHVDTRSFLLRPHPEPGRTLEAFRAYTRSWLRPAADPDGGTFRPWATDAGPPSHSVPPHLVAKAAKTLGDDAFARIDERLLHAYFAENRDITDAATLRAVWREAGLPDAEFARAADPALLEQTFAEHEEALAHGVTGVPAVRIEGRPGLVVGAQPLDVYRSWIRRIVTPTSASPRGHGPSA
jgi:predicted DsbA family dithiol-disulfide isomerase